MTPSHPAQTVLIEGGDALAFAQSQFSCNLSDMTPGHWRLGAWLDPQGKVRYLFHLACVATDRLMLLLRGGRAAAMAGELRRYLLRSKATITPIESGSISKSSPLDYGRLEVQTSIISFGLGDHAMTIGQQANDDWRLAQIRQGIPWLPEAVLGRLLTPALSLMRLGATALDKGCYPGQEMVARLHYRGGHKRHMHRVVLPDTCDAGMTLNLHPETDIQWLDVAPSNGVHEALAVLPDDALDALRHDNRGLRIITTWPE